MEILDNPLALALCWFIIVVILGFLIKHEWENMKRHNEMVRQGIIAIGRRHREREARRTEQKIFDDEFLRIRTAVLKRDNYRCVNCGMTGKELHVHHVVPRSEGGTNDLSNLVTLCSRCHSVQDAKGHYLIQANKQEDEIEEDTAFGMPIDMLEEDR